MSEGNVIMVSFGKPPPISSVNNAGNGRDGACNAQTAPTSIIDRIACRNGAFFQRMRIRMVVSDSGVVGIKIALSVEDRQWMEDNLSFVETYLSGITTIRLPDCDREWSALPNSRPIVAFCEEATDIVRFYFYTGEADKGKESYSAPRVHFNFAQ